MVYIYIYHDSGHILDRACAPLKKKIMIQTWAKIPILFVLGVGLRCIHKVYAYILVMSM